MREILFRGKRTDNGEWIEGYLNQHRGGVIFDCCCNAINANDYYINDWTEKLDTDLYGCVYKVDPETVGQYTGLTDKNGAKIFEGDIIRFDDDIGYVIYNGDTASFLVDSPNRYISMDYSSEFEVIGNIHDNPEILKVGDNNE